MTDSIIAFLKMIRPFGPWTLYAMEPDAPYPGVKETKTFMPGEEGLIQQFIVKHIGKDNMYFLVNPANQPVTKNPEKDMIQEVQYFHVDIDPDSKKDFGMERERIKRLLESRSVPPTVIIDSGGGFQALWKLEKPITIIAEGETNNIAEVEAYNRQLEREFAADHCHNINRLLRLPYTTNFPTRTKRERGRVQAPTGLVKFDDTLVYPAHSFIKAEVIASNTAIGECDVIDFGAVGPIDINSLGNITDRFKQVIINGNTSDNAYKGRSEAMFAAVCHMVRQGVSDTDIASVLLDRHYKISAHVYDQARNPQEYVKRQISRAKTAEKEKNGYALLKMNERYCVAQDGEHTFIYSEEYDHELEHPYLKKQKLDQFQQFYANQVVELETDKGTKEVELAKWWFKHPRRRSYHQVVFLPNKDIPGTLNLWQGMKYEPKPGKWDLFLNHIQNVICNNNAEYMEYLLNWMARAVQQPGEQGHVAVVLRGPRGGGKGTFVEIFGDMFGRHFLQVSNPKHVTGHFNAHLRETVILHADEAFFAGDKASESVLKTLITEKRLPIEGKFVNVAQKKNALKIIMCSNQDWVVPAGDSERRFFVLDVNSKHNQDTSYFEPIREQMSNGGSEAMLHSLMTRDISKFSVWKFPKTKALNDQQLLSAGPDYRWWYEKLRMGQIIPSQMDWTDRVSARAVLEDYQDSANMMGSRFKQINLDRFYAKVLPTGNPPNRKQDMIAVRNAATGVTERVKETFYLFPSLADCRASFCKAMDITHITWPDMPDLVKRDETEEAF